MFIINIFIIILDLVLYKRGKKRYTERRIYTYKIRFEVKQSYLMDNIFYIHPHQDK